MKPHCESMKLLRNPLTEKGFPQLAFSDSLACFRESALLIIMKKL